MTPKFSWRGPFGNPEVNELHAEAFSHPVLDDWDWVSQCEAHSLGWVTARIGDRLVGFVNVPWDGLVHAWIQDEMVAADARRQGVGIGLIHAARDGANARNGHGQADDPAVPRWEKAGVRASEPLRR